MILLLYLPLTRPAIAPEEVVLSLDGADDAVILTPEASNLPNGSMTLETWFRADDLSGRIGLATRTENSEYGIFLSDGIPDFMIHLNRAYRSAKGAAGLVSTDRWHHIAGVFDEDEGEVRLYLDGRLIDSAPASGNRTSNRLPFIVGADVDGNGRPVSFFDGQVDGVRLSKVARYRGDSFVPVRRHAVDEDTQLLLNFDDIQVDWTYDESLRGNHPLCVGGPEIVPADN